MTDLANFIKGKKSITFSNANCNSKKDVIKLLMEGKELFYEDSYMIYDSGENVWGVPIVYFGDISVNRYEAIDEMFANYPDLLVATYES